MWYHFTQFAPRSKIRDLTISTSIPRYRYDIYCDTTSNDLEEVEVKLTFIIQQLNSECCNVCKKTHKDQPAESACWFFDSLLLFLLSRFLTQGNQNGSTCQIHILKFTNLSFGSLLPLAASLILTPLQDLFKRVEG